MEVIDDRGFIFGRVNIIDALVVLLIIAVLTAGVALVTSSGEAQTSQEIVFRTSPQPPFVIDSIEVGPVRTDGIIAVREKSVTQVDSEHIARLRIELEVSLTRDDLPRFRGERLYVGRELKLDLGSTIVDGVVIELGR